MVAPSPISMSSGCGPNTMTSTPVTAASYPAPVRRAGMEARDVLYLCGPFQRSGVEQAIAVEDADHEPPVLEMQGDRLPAHVGGIPGMRDQRHVEPSVARNVQLPRGRSDDHELLP